MKENVKLLSVLALPDVAKLTIFTLHCPLAVLVSLLSIQCNEVPKLSTPTHTLQWNVYIYTYCCHFLQQFLVYNFSMRFHSEIKRQFQRFNNLVSEQTPWVTPPLTPPTQQIMYSSTSHKWSVGEAVQHYIRTPVDLEWQSSALPLLDSRHPLDTRTRTFFWLSKRNGLVAWEHGCMFYGWCIRFYLICFSSLCVCACACLHCAHSYVLAYKSYRVHPMYVSSDPLCILNAWPDETSFPKLCH